MAVVVVVLVLVVVGVGWGGGVASTVLDHVTVGLFVVFMYNIYVYMLGSLF